MVSPAQVPSTPVSPDPLRIGMIGAVLGLVLGIRQAAVGLEHLDDRIRSRDDVERFIGTQPPVLAAIPRLRLPRRPRDRRWLEPPRARRGLPIT